MCFAVAQPPRLPSHKYLRDECCLGCNYLTQAMSWWNECLGSISLMECRSVGPGMWEWRREPERRPGGLFPWTGVMTSEAARELNSSFSSARNMAWGTHRAYCLGSLCIIVVLSPYFTFFLWAVGVSSALLVGTSVMGIHLSNSQE